MRFARMAAMVMMVLLLASGALSSPARAEVSYSFFYSNLAPAGSWMVSAQYGRVWQPDVYRAGWNPYYDGHWVYTDLGWTWVSDYEWGAIPYHYGTWAQDPAFGWVWVPGHVWAPSWVVFRTGPDYIGWAPVAPGFSVGVSVGFIEPPAQSFLFVSCGDFLVPHVRGHVAPYSRSRVILGNTRVVNRLVVENNVVVNRGPDVSIIERASGRRLRPVPIERVSRVAPGPRVTRAGLRIDPARARGGVRAVEPVRSNESSPPSRRPASGGEERFTPHASREEQRLQKQHRAPQPRDNGAVESRQRRLVSPREEGASRESPARLAPHAGTGDSHSGPGPSRMQRPASGSAPASRVRQKNSKPPSSRRSDPKKEGGSSHKNGKGGGHH